MEISNQPSARERLIIFHGNAILTFHCWRKNYISEKVSHFIHTFLPCVSVAQAFSQRPRMATTPQKFHSIFFLIYYLELFLNEYWPRKWNVLEMIFRKFIHCLITNYISTNCNNILIRKRILRWSGRKVIRQSEMRNGWVMIFFLWRLMVDCNEFGVAKIVQCAWYAYLIGCTLNVGKSEPFCCDFH